LLIDAAKLQFILESIKVLGYSASICDEWRMIRFVSIINNSDIP